MKAAFFDDQLEQSVSFIAVSHGKDTMPLLIRAPETFGELKSFARKRFRLDSKKKLVVYVPKERIGLGEDLELEADGYETFAQHLYRLVVEQTEEDDSEVERDDQAQPFTPPPSMSPQGKGKQVLEQEEEEKPKQHQQRPASRHLISKSRSQQSSRVATETEPEEEEEEEEEDEEQVISKVYSPRSPTKKSKKVIVSEDEDEEAEEEVATAVYRSTKKNREDEEARGDGHEGGSQGSTSSADYVHVLGDSQVEEQPSMQESSRSRAAMHTASYDGDTGIRMKSAPAVKEEKSSSVLPIQPVTKNRAPAERDENEAFLVVIAHAASGREIRCKVRGRNVIKKVIDGVCKGLKIDPARSQLYLLRSSVRDDIEMTDRVRCEKDDVVQKYAIGEMSKLEIVQEK